MWRQKKEKKEKKEKKKKTKKKKKKKTQDKTAVFGVLETSGARQFGKKVGCASVGFLHKPQGRTRERERERGNPRLEVRDRFSVSVLAMGRSEWRRSARWRAEMGGRLAWAGCEAEARRESSASPVRQPGCARAAGGASAMRPTTEGAVPSLQHAGPRVRAGIASLCGAGVAKAGGKHVQAHASGRHVLRLGSVPNARRTGRGFWRRRSWTREGGEGQYLNVVVGQDV